MNVILGWRIYLKKQSFKAQVGLEVANASHQGPFCGSSKNELRKILSSSHLQ